MKFSSLANRNFKEIFRDPITLLLGVAMPVMMLLLMSPISKLEGAPDLFTPTKLTPSIIIFSFSFLIMFSGTLLGKDSKTAFLTRLLSTPLKPLDFLLAYLLPFLPVALFQIVVCYGVGLILGADFQQIGFSVLIFFVMAILCISIGMIAGALLNLNQISAIGAILITVASLFSGAWMDLKMVGGFFETIGYILPFAHAIDALKALAVGASFSSISTNFIVILVYAIVFFVLAVLSFYRSTRKR